MNDDCGDEGRWMLELIGVKLEVPEHWFSWDPKRTGKQLRSTKLWDCTIIDAKLSTASDADPCFVIECDTQTDEDGPYDMRYSDVRKHSFKILPVDPMVGYSYEELLGSFSRQEMRRILDKMV